jgi:hypothetical protein
MKTNAISVITTTIGNRMQAPNNFDAVKYLEDIYNGYPLVELYFIRGQSELMDSIDELYSMLNLQDEDVPLTVIDMLERG